MFRVTRIAPGRRLIPLKWIKPAYLKAGMTSLVMMRRLFVTWGSLNMPPAFISAVMPSMPSTSRHSLIRSINRVAVPKATRSRNISSYDSADNVAAVLARAALPPLGEEAATRRACRSK